MNFLIREVDTKDLEDLYKLSTKAVFINLPSDRNLLTKKIHRSQLSFKAKLRDLRDAEYIFVLEDRTKGKVVGTSMIIAQHGTPEEPHTYFAVVEKKKVSKSLHIGFLHKVLRLGFMFDGPTEIGGLVLDPEYRNHPEKLGKLLSFTRFEFMSARRPQFKEEVLSELMPPFNERGESILWEEIGRRFTNLNYHEADKLSRRNKEFVTSLFPEGDIYTCMLSGEARESIGQVGPDTLPVKKMLESIGFQYRNMIDPFDGGPHFWAKTSHIDPVKKTRRVVYREGTKSRTPMKAHSGLLMNFSKKGIRATFTEIYIGSAKVPEFQCSAEVANILGLEPALESYFLEIKI